MRINERDSMYGMISPVYAVALVAYAVFCFYFCAELFT